MEFFAKDFNRSNVVACFKMVKYETVFENSVNARLLVQLTQYTVIMLRRNVDQYFHGARTSNPVDYVRVRLPAELKGDALVLGGAVELNGVIRCVMAAYFI